MRVIYMKIWAEGGLDKMRWYGPGPKGLGMLPGRPGTENLLPKLVDVAPGRAVKRVPGAFGEQLPDCSFQPVETAGETTVEFFQVMEAQPMRSLFRHGTAGYLFRQYHSSDSRRKPWQRTNGPLPTTIAWR